VLTRFLALQADALPILAAWLEDTTPTPHLVMPRGGHIDGFDIDMAEMIGQMENNAQIQAMLAGMEDVQNQTEAVLPGPQTREDIARILCGGILPASMGDNYNSALTVTQDDILEFAAMIKDKKGIDLARFYFEEGTESQRSVAMAFMMSKGTDADFKKIEQEILNADEEYESAEMLQMYLMNRGKDGLALADKVAATYEEDYSKRMLENTKKQLGLQTDKKEIKEKTFDEELAALVTSRIEEGQDPEEVCKPLLTSFTKIPVKKRIAALEKALKIMAEVKDPQKSVALIYLLSYARFQENIMREYDPEEMKTVTWEEFLAAPERPEGDNENEYDEYSEFSQEWDAAAMVKSIRQHKDVWLKLLRREDSLEELSFYGGTATFGGQITAAMHNLVAPDIKSLMSLEGEKLNSLPDQGAAFWLSSAIAIIEGKTDTGLPLPSADKVSNTRKTELIATFKTAEGEELATFIKTMTDQFLTAGSNHRNQPGTSFNETNDGRGGPGRRHGKCQL